MTKTKKYALIILISVLVLAVAYATISVVKMSLHNKYPSQTFVSDVDISKLTPQEATALLQEKVHKHLNQETSLSLKEEQKTLKNKNLGIQFQIPETLEQISTIDTSKKNIFQLIFSKSQPSNTPLIIDFQKDQLSQNINQQFSLQEFYPKNAAYYLEGSKLMITEEVSGEKIDTQNLLEQLTKNAQNLTNTPITIQTISSLPDITKQQLQDTKETYSNKLRKKITLVDPVYSDNWQITLAKNPEWVKFVDPNQQNPLFPQKESEIFIQINPDPFNQYLDEEISQWLDREPDTLKIFYDQDQKIKVEGKGHDGRKILREKFIQQLEQNLKQPDQDEVIIPIQHLPAILDIAPEIQKMGIKEILSVGHTSYYGSPSNRIHNIKVGAQKFNGLLINPGEEFSFNQNLGAVNGATGYRKELVIKPEGTIPEYGGGLCQVSTTIYRAVLLAGLDITNRREHSYAVSYYSQILGHGLDATIYIGGQDFKFKNNTETPILISSYVENDYELYFLFLGTSDGRTVELEGPVISNYRSPGPTKYIDTDTLPEGTTKQVEKRHTGFDVLWKRHITDKEGNTETEEITTKYKAVPAKIMVGTKPAPSTSSEPL